MRAASTLLTLAASTSYAVAWVGPVWLICQAHPEYYSLSTGCTTQLGALALGGLGSCLQLTSLLPVLSVGSSLPARAIANLNISKSSGSVVDPINTYLKSLCGSSTPTCSNDTLSSASSSISSACSSDLSDGGTSGAEVKTLLALINHYDQAYAAACSTNSS